MNEILPHRRRVLYYETDKMGIVHHSNYIRYMEEGRLEYMRQAGLVYKDLESRGILMPVTGVSSVPHIWHLIPLRLYSVSTLAA